MSFDSKNTVGGMKEEECQAGAKEQQDKGRESWGSRILVHCFGIIGARQTVFGVQTRSAFDPAEYWYRMGTISVPERLQMGIREVRIVYLPGKGYVSRT